MTASPLIKKIEEILFLYDEIPLLRGEAIDLKVLSKSLAQDLSLENLDLEFQKTCWEKTQDLLAPLGEKPLQLGLALTPLVGTFYLIIGQNELTEMVMAFFKTEKKAQLSLALKEGFWRYLVLMVLNRLQKEKLFQGLNFKIIENVEIKSQNALAVDFKVSLNQKSLPIRLALTPDFRLSWNRHQAEAPSLFQQKMKENLQLPVSFILAQSTFLPKELEQIKKGDFLLLEKIYFHPKSHHDNLRIYLQKIPLFQAKLKKDKIQITDLAHLEENTMPENQGPETLSLKDLPVTLTVELAKMQMPLKELSSLQTGNFLEMPSSIEEGVFLCVNGKKIGRGELVHLGDKLGVRVLELG
ncbi:MAG: type III secretion system cytoplasmic ring protein SctQ [Parachlamydiales bacterium]|jgi:flagellar motor switch protein FliN/FliY